MRTREREGEGGRRWELRQRVTGNLFDYSAALNCSPVS
jgi:hypothetical protein